MNITFVAMGSELLGLESMSAVLKKHGHNVNLAFEPALFDDKVYFHIKPLAKLFSSKKHIIKKIIDSKPDVIGFSVISLTYQWSIRIAKELKKQLKDTPIIFGGVYAMSNPETVLKQDCVDVVCIGDGEYPLLELVESLKKGKIDTKIKNLWFKKDGKIIKNDLRTPVKFDDYPMFDKDLFNKHIPIKNSYLTIASKGCPFNCTYCSQNFLQPIMSGNKKKTHFELRNVDNIINELKTMKERYNFQIVEMWDNTFTANKKWTLDFCKKYKEQVNVPYRILTHPMCIDEEVAQALKDSGCYKVQFGVQSMDEKIRAEILNRHESNEMVLKGFESCDKAGLNYSIDHIFGLPGDNDIEGNLKDAISHYVKCKNCIQVRCFWLTLFPKSEMVDIALKHGMVTEEDIKRIDNAESDDLYMFKGSLKEKEMIKLFQRYQILMESIPILSEKTVNFILRNNIHYKFRYLPKLFTKWCVDMTSSLIKGDLKGVQYLKYYLWQFKNMFKSRILRLS